MEGQGTTTTDRLTVCKVRSSQAVSVVTARGRGDCMLPSVVVMFVSRGGAVSCLQYKV